MACAPKSCRSSRIGRTSPERVGQIEAQLVRAGIFVVGADGMALAAVSRRGWCCRIPVNGGELWKALRSAKARRVL
jgi:hypothetical protein